MKLEALGFLSGAWVHVTDDGRVEEHWIPPSAGSMLGMNRTISGGETVFYETLRVDVDGDRVLYVAWPKGAKRPTSFVLVDADIGKVVFENPKHDFPQRIVYELEGSDRLHIRLEGEERGAPVVQDLAMRRAIVEIPATTRPAASR
jgi:hypothetical protein